MLYLHWSHTVVQFVDFLRYELVMRDYVHPASYSVDSLALVLPITWSYSALSGAKVKMELYFDVSLYILMACGWKHKDLYVYIN
jgi:hypothetical protein